MTEAAATLREEKRRDAMDAAEEAGAEELSLGDILKLYSQPINEEQAWAVCYQCCRSLAEAHRGRRSSAAAGASPAAPRRISGPGDVRIERDGSVRVEPLGCGGKC